MTLCSHCSLRLLCPGRLRLLHRQLDGSDLVADPGVAGRWVEREEGGGRTDGRCWMAERELPDGGAQGGGERVAARKEEREGIG